MRESYRAYESAPEVLVEAMTIGWTQNVVILEAELTLQGRAWYIQAVQRFGWSKLELQRMIDAKEHLEVVLDFTGDACSSGENPALTECVTNDESQTYLPLRYPTYPNIQD